MSFKISYKCSNKDCPLSVHLYSRLPVWKKDTPKEFIKLPVGLHNQKYVDHYINEERCLKCGEDVDIPESENTCPKCGVANNLLAIGTRCPLCGIGIVSEDNTKRMCF